MRRSDVPIYGLAILFGICAGFIEVKLGDILITAVTVLASTLVLGFLRPQRAWRWIAVVGVFVPLARIAVYVVFGQKPYKAQVWAAALGFVTGIAGSYGGGMIRLGVDTLFRKQEQGDSPRGHRDTGKTELNH
jgi:hypothetical protein